MKVLVPVAILALTVTSSACRKPVPIPAAELLQRGDELVQKQDYAAAAEAYRAAVQTDGRNGETRLKLARAYLQAGNTPAAAAEAIRAADLLPDDSDAQQLAISMMLSQQRFLDALDRIAKRLQVEPGNPALHVMFGNATARLPSSRAAVEKFDEAVRSGRNYDQVLTDLRPLKAGVNDRAAQEAFRRALRLSPGMPEARWALANVLWAGGHMEEGQAILRQVADENPADVLASRALGVFYLSQGRPADAEKYLKIAASSNDLTSRTTLADYYISAKRDSEALSILDVLAAGNDQGGASALKAGNIELRLGKYDAALRRANAILTRDPNNPVALRIKAQVAYATGHAEEAVTLARIAVRADPDSSEARKVLSRCLVATGDLEAAFDELSEAWRGDPSNAELAKELAGLALALHRDAVAVEYARDGIRLAPNDSASARILVKALIHLGRISDADRTLRPLLSQDGASADELVLLASIQAARGGKDEARNTYLRALQVNRDSLEALSGLVTLDLGDRQFAGARQRVDQAISTHPHDPEYLLLGARVAAAGGDKAGAESTLRSILKASPTHEAATELLADVLVREGRRDDAQHAIEDALARRPVSLALQVSLANLLETSGRIAEAQARYERIIAEHADAYSVSSMLAASYANQGTNLDAALSLARAAKQRAPTDAFVTDTLGWVYVRKGLPLLGLPHLRDAVRAEPANAEYRYHLGVAYQGARQTGLARDELTRALTLDPNFPAAKAARVALASLPK